MAKILCSISGIEFQCEHFPIALTHGESHHPIFNVPLKRLWKYFPKWQSGELTKTDSFLYFLSLLNATEMVEFRCHVHQRPDTDRIVSANMESLFYTIGKVITIRHPKFVIPRFVVSAETRDLSNVSHWIKCWNDALEEFATGLKDQELRSRLERKTNALERLIKNPALNPAKYCHLLADWASEAAAFPQFEIIDPVSGNETTISEYWKHIIMLCYQKESLLSIPESDIRELLEHCETEIDLGSIQSYHLFNTLREGLETVQGFFGSSSPVFSILSDDSNEALADANLSILKSTAPSEKPKRTAYPTEFAFHKALMLWNLAKKTGEI